VVATERLPELIAAARRGDAAGVMAAVESISEHAPDFGGLLREVVTLLHRIAVIQQVPSAAQSSWGETARLQALAGEIPPEEIQLFYQIALTGQRDLPLAPDARSGFEMVMLRMLAFRPEATPSATNDAPVPTRVDGQARVPDGERLQGAKRPGPPQAPRPSSGKAPEPAGQEQPATPRLDTEFSDWHGFVSRLGLKGMTAQLADNCAFDAWDGKQLSLRLDPVCQGLVGSLAEQRLQEAVAEAVGTTVSLQLTVEASEQETPAQRQAREARVRQEETEADISADPLVLGVQENFDADIVPESIRPIE